MTRHFAAFAICLGLGCGAVPPAPATAPEIEPLKDLGAPAARADAKGEPTSSRASAPGRGGRLFDNWYREVEADFDPDDPGTDAIDGRGGPFGNGSLPGAAGQPMANTGHDFRLVNLFGVDLRGQQGIYGPGRAHHEGVLVPSFLDDTDSRAHWIERLTSGGDAIPAYGAVLSAKDVAAVVDFMLAVREGSLPQPDDVYLLSDTVGHYQLREGGDAERGHALFAERCAGCHGADGTEETLDAGAHTLGTLARTEAYEVFLELLSGHPGSDMHAQVQGDRAAQAAQALDLLTALCDRIRYPQGDARTPDVPDGDPRCGSALK